MSIIEKALKSKKANVAAVPKAAPKAVPTAAQAELSTQETGSSGLSAMERGAELAKSTVFDADPLDTGLHASARAQEADFELDMARTRDAHHQSSGNAQAAIEIPFESLQERGFLSPLTPRSRLAEEFRTIKRPILKNIEGGAGARIVRPNLVMVTSALQGDGKTFSSINLAISIAMEQDKTVLFVDADVVRATAGKTLGVKPGTPGLIDLLHDGSDIEPADVILRTNMDKLRVLPAGNASDQSTELLASQTMQDFMLELSGRYPDRVIVFDSPPLLLTTEASVLASFMGQIVFVASADVTPMNAISEALEHIGEDKMVGVVLNRASRRRSKLLGIGSYGYGYGYGYGDSYAQNADRPSEPPRQSSSQSS